MCPSRRVWWLAVSALLLALVLAASARAADEWPWYTVDGQKQVRVKVYVFYRETCPHCQDALRFLRALNDRHNWLDITCYEVATNPANLDFYRRMAESLNRQAGPVPGIFYCKQVEIGYDSDDRTGARIERGLIRCYEAIRKQQANPPAEPPPRGLMGVVFLQPPLDLPPDAFPAEELVDVPWLGEVDAAQVSLLTLTVVLGLCDSVNPCAFFVLLFLLSLMVHAHSRWKMAVVGATFVFFSGLVYFLFMAAWLNLFYLVGHLPLITALAGGVAVVIAAVNIKDFFWFKQGVSLSIPEAARPGLFQRMTDLVRATGFVPVLAGAAVLAATANLYELLCTAGFPLVYTRVLTLRDLSAGEHALWLVLYNVLYVLPLAVIVTAFTLTLGSRKLTEYEGRVLKLLSGMMMLLLGVALLAAPQVLTTVVGAAGLLVAAVVATAVIVVLDRRTNRPVPETASPPVTVPAEAREPVRR